MWDVTSHMVSDSFGSLGSCHGPAARSASGGGRRRGVGRAHPAGHAPQGTCLARRGEIATNQDTDPDQLFPVNPCRTMCSRWPTSELPPTCVTAAWCGPTTIMLAREVGAPSSTTWRRPAVHLLVAGKAHHRPGTFDSRHIRVSKGKLHI
jgi:hypothetical protein